jgi:DNA polymerase I-like protein with 3'-5' exonuclease and polymerase domains
MSEFVPLAVSLDALLRSSKTVYMRCEPEVLDFTDNTAAGVLFFAAGQEECRVPVAPRHIRSILGLLKASIFDKGRTVVAWKLKNLLAYVRHHTRVNFDFEANAFDLHAAEGFLDVREEAPATYIDAMQRVKRAVTHPAWGKAKVVHNRVHLPLILKVLPAIETAGVWDSTLKKRLYPYYEVEGQSGGRLRCSKAYQYGFTPHSITPEQRQSFIPTELGETFVYFDFQHMEVSVLHWLSKDENLGKLVNSPGDLYKNAFQLITSMPCENDKQRQICKEILLPVFFGEQPPALAEALKISLMLAEKIHARIHSLFPTAMTWIAQDQDAGTTVFQDHFGHLRILTEKRHRARNFLVQSPASLACLDKLIRLHDALGSYGRIVAHIHDGYIVASSVAASKSVISIGRAALQRESDMCPGLHLKVSCKVGRSLATMTSAEEE